MTRRLIGALFAALLVVATSASPARADDPADNPPQLWLTQFENASSGLCLDILVRGDVNGSPAVQDVCPWSLGFQSVTARWPRYFLVIRGVVPKCLEVEGFSTANYASVAQHDCNGGPHQQWRYIPSGYGGTSRAAQWLADAIEIQSVWSGKCLEVYQYSLSDIAIIDQYDCYKGTNQLWFQEFGEIPVGPH